ncbi:MAG TPA: hypothetical protein PLF25_01735 [Accumulibacter sp.]|nr:hypothetical protein [Accumulibacter sp.]
MTISVDIGSRLNTLPAATLRRQAIGDSVPPSQRIACRPGQRSAR